MKILSHLNLSQSQDPISRIFSPVHHAVKRTELPKVGDLVHVSSFGKKGTVIKVEPSKEEIVVQAGNMKWIMKFTDIVTY